VLYFAFSWKSLNLDKNNFDYLVVLFPFFFCFPRISEVCILDISEYLSHGNWSTVLICLRQTAVRSIA